MNPQPCAGPGGVVHLRRAERVTLCGQLAGADVATIEAAGGCIPCMLKAAARIGPRVEKVRRERDRRLEDRLCGQLRAWPHLPEPRREYAWAEHLGRAWRADLAWTDARILVEVEGATWTAGRHSRGAGFEADAIKYAAASLEGWTVLRVTGDLIEGGFAARWVAAAYERWRWVTPGHVERAQAAVRGSGLDRCPPPLDPGLFPTPSEMKPARKRARAEAARR